MPQPSKQTVLERLLEDPDDEAAWSDLYVEFWPIVYSRAYYLLKGDVQQSKDVSQEVFVRLAKYRPFARLVSLEKFNTYLGTMCFNLVSDLWRQSVVESYGIQPGNILGSHYSAEDDRAAAVRETLEIVHNRLNDDERILLGLLLDGATTAEISERLGLSSQNARVRAHRLRAKLKRMADEI